MGVPWDVPGAPHHLWRHFRTERTHPTVFRGWLRGLSDRRGAAYGVGFPVALQDWDFAEKRRAHICKDDRVCPDIRFQKNRSDALQLLALGTGLWVMVGVVFFRFQVEKKRKVTPPDKD